MLVVECPQQYTTVDPHMPYSVFMAGGMAGCPDWQKEIINLLEPVPGTLLNPRQSTNSIDSSDATNYEQLTWALEHMHRAGAILFWFSCEHLCPASLFELGVWLRESKPLFIGVHPNYTRRVTIEVLIQSVRPNQKIVYSLRDLAIEVGGMSF